MKRVPVAGAATSVTGAPALKVALHSGPQSMPDGVDRTDLGPVTRTESRASCSGGGGSASKRAESWASPLSVILQSPCPTHAPLQPPNR